MSLLKVILLNPIIIKCINSFFPPIKKLRDDIIEFLVLHLQDTYFIYLNNSDLIISEIIIYIKFIITLDMWKLPLDINKLEKYIYDNMFIFLNKKILLFNNKLDDFDDYLRIENNFNEYGNQLLYDMYSIYFYDSMHTFYNYKYYCEKYTIYQTLTILQTFKLAENEEYINIAKQLIKYHIYYQKDKLSNKCILCNSLNIQTINDEILNHKTNKKENITYFICYLCKKLKYLF